MARILVVDDHEGVAGVFGDIVTEAGHEVAFAATANEAASSAIRNRFDLVIMDMALRQSSGVTAALALRGLGYDGPIIGVTGGLVPSDERLLERARFAAMLRKPLMPVDLRAAIDRELARGNVGC